MVTAAPAIDPASPSGEDDLVTLAREGRESAIRMIVQRYNRRLYRIARAVLRDDTEAEDAVQDAYVKAFTNLDSFRGDASLATWLTRIALNEALSRRRRRKTRADFLNDNDPAEVSVIMFPSSISMSNPEAELARQQIRGLLEKAVDELPESFRVVFVLRDVEELSIEETARYLSIKPQTVKTRLHRAHSRIRDLLNQQFSAAYSDLFPFDGERCSRMAENVVLRLRAASRAPGNDH